MDFDEYDYLEKTVQENDDRDSKKKAKKEATEKSYRKREVDDDVSADEDRKSSKRSRGGEHENGRDKEKDRDRHHRSSGGGRERDRDGERDRDRDRGGERERERDRERSSREKEKERERRDRDKEKEKEREKEKEKERERRERRERDDRERREKDEKERSRRSVSRSDREEKERSRRSVSRSDREEKERSRRSRSHTDRDREREVREKEREIEMNESRRFKDKKEMVEPEADPERDQRTVFAYQMPLKATERDVYEFFSKAGKVRDVRLIMDRNSRRSKGVGNAIMMRDGGNTLHSCLINSCCALKSSDSSKEIQIELSALEFLFPYVSLIYALYIEFYDAMHVPMAIALSGQLLLGQPVMVKPSEAEKNLVQSTATGGTTGVVGPYGAVDRKLYVGNLHFNMTETHLREIFEPFGPVELVQLPLDIETSQCKGFGFVQFAHLEHAKAAQSLNGKLDIAGRTIKVSSVTDHVGSQETGAKSADFDDDDGGGLSLNAQSRALLMQKLDRTGTATSIAGSLGVPGLNGSAPNQRAVNLPMNGQATLSAPFLPAKMPAVAEPIGNPSECLLLKDMFDPATETEPDFDVDIKDDVEDECSKYGRVKHIYVEKNSAGFVYLRFETVEAAAAAQRAMHLRWFAGRQISALFMQPQVYEAKFGV